MIKKYCLILILFSLPKLWAQITLVGFCKKNNVSLKTAEVQVFSENILQKSLKPNNKGVITIDLLTGKDYVIKLNEPTSIPMYFEVRAKNASVEGVTTHMRIETDIPFFYK